MNRRNKYLLKTKGSFPHQNYRGKVDHFEAVLKESFEEIDCPLKHEFVNGMYIRTIFMPAGTLISSKIHKTQHPFVITEGAVSVKLNDNEWQLLEKGHMGITQPGTHRILYIHYDTVWTTFHPNPDNCTDIEEIERRIILKHENRLITQKEKKCLT